MYQFNLQQHAVACLCAESDVKHQPTVSVFTL